ncbi:uncharacterized protein LOC143621441 [Bidens hawaiensis]|uniref:uncharacterized protein LOC143621441 n=1 Tax=Bidens hawaiensis TaxID=980011 RepID=UPI00404A92D8
MEKNLRDRSQATNNNSTTNTTPSDFVLQWGNRKRLRCMKSGTPPVAQPSTTARGDRRHQNNKEAVNLRQRSSSPAHRVLRNCESSSIAMKGQSNGVHDKRGAHHNGKNNNNNGGESGSSETAHDSKKGGGSPGNEAVPVVWPPKFVIGLTNKEKEEDFLAIKGSKLPQRPKKRAKFIQRTINSVIPGGWLCDLTLERYEVREKKITKKRPRGLKAMGGMESESE